MLDHLPLDEFFHEVGKLYYGEQNSPRFQIDPMKPAILRDNCLVYLPLVDYQELMRNFIVYNSGYYDDIYYHTWYGIIRIRSHHDNQRYVPNLKLVEMIYEDVI